MPTDLLLDPEARAAVWRNAVAAIEDYMEEVPRRPVSRVFAPRELEAFLARIDFERPLDPGEAVRYVVTGFDRFHAHNAHPRYFGLFLPASSTMGMVGDLLAAAWNPVLAAWRLSPFAVAVEQRLISEVAARFGYDGRSSEGCFTSGGSEANHTAVLVALLRAFPAVATEGLRAVDRQPVLYVSAEGHHSILKAARLTGLGEAAVRRVAVDGHLRIDLDRLVDSIRADRASGRAPFMLVATAGSTSAGVMDPLGDLAAVAEEERLWLHVDAAWGGAGVLVPALRGLFAGIERSDSLTFDPHKWLSVPMGAGLFVTRHAGVLEPTFTVDEPYMTRTDGDGARPDFYRRSMIWARRFTGLKLFLTLAVAGWKGYEEVVRHQIALGDHLRRRLVDAGFVVVNHTPLPVVCFVDGRDPVGANPEAIAAGVVASGRAWISTTRLGDSGRLVLRAAMTNFRTTTGDVDALVETLVDARRTAAATPSQAGGGA